MTLNEKITRLTQIKKQLKKLSDEKDMLEDELKSHHSRNFKTEDFEVEIVENYRESMKSVSLVAEVFSRAVLERHNLINKTTFFTLDIQKRAKKGAA